MHRVLLFSVTCTLSWYGIALQCRKIIFWARARPGNLRVSLTPREISPFSHSSFSSPTSSSFSYFFRLLSHGHLNNSHHSLRGLTPREVPCERSRNTPFSHLFPQHSNHIERLDREPPLLALGAYKCISTTPKCNRGLNVPKCESNGD